MFEQDYATVAKQVIKLEGKAVTRLAETLDCDSFNDLVASVLKCKAKGGRVIVTGKGNSGMVAHKISYSLCCVDIPAVYLAPGEGVHASTGLIQPGDILIAVSRGGDSEEVVELMKIARQKNARTVAVTANPASPMALLSDLMLRVSIDRDAEAHDYLATSSMLAMIAVFDAVALSIQPSKRLQVMAEK